LNNIRIENLTIDPVLHVKVSAIDGNDYCFYHNGALNKYDLFDAIRDGKRIQTCDGFGDDTPVLTSFVVQNIIRINVKRVDVKVKPNSKKEKAPLILVTTKNNDVVLANDKLSK
jgi:hypothetical protein